MFLRKLFNAENKLNWILIDFVIVIAGVYCAFLIQEYAENQKVQKEKEEILSALKYELEFFRVQMPGRAGYSINKATTWRKQYNEGNYTDYSDWRFIEPQYEYQVISHALSVQNSAIIPFNLYRGLQEVYTQTKRIEHIERTITALGFRYQNVPEQAQKRTIEYEIIWQKNYDDFNRLILAMNDRAEDQRLLSQLASEAVAIVNDQLDPLVKRSIEEDLIVTYIDKLVNNEEEAVVAAGRAFPDFTEEEVRIMYRKAIGALEEEASENSPSE